MRIEVKGLIAAMIAGSAVVGGAYGVSVLVAGAHSDTQKKMKPASATAKSAPRADAALVAQGHRYYTKSCANCHGDNAQGGYGPSLGHEDMTDTQIALKISNGVPGKMPAFAKKYDAGQTQALVAYVRSLK